MSGSGTPVAGVFSDRYVNLAQPRLGAAVVWANDEFFGAKERLIDPTKHLILRSPHPSPLSAHRGFIGNGHFSRANRYLEQHGMAPIDWRLPELAEG